MTHELWLLRHGQSTGNRQRLRQGHRDFPLSEEGRRQVEALAARWQARNPVFEAAITSPLRRAAQSASILADALGFPLEEDARWIERDAGQAGGTPLPVDPGQRARPHRTAAHRPPFPGAESRIALHLRAASATSALLERPPGRYLVVAHGGILAAAVLGLLGMIPTGQAALPGISFDNAGFAVVRLDEARGHWVLERLNDSCHLRP